MVRRGIVPGKWRGDGNHGTEIPARLIDRVFPLFVQGERALDRSQGGLGLGLALVRSLVDMHGGSVRATSPGPARAPSSRCACRG
jgi:two-component system CheB/CheR fusion protein